MPTPPTRRRPAKLPQLITTEADIAAGVRALRRKCSVFRHMHTLAGDPPLRRRPAGYEGLARIIVGQQLSVASAAAIWERTYAAVQPFRAPALLALSDDALRAAGLSGGKIRTLRAMSAAVVDGLDLETLDRHDDKAVHDALTSISGIGPWTADVFIMFCLGRADAFAAGDLALQIAAQWALERDTRPNPDELIEFAERWRPWRGVAARMLWTYYAAVKKARTGAPV